MVPHISVARNRSPQGFNISRAPQVWFNQVEAIFLNMGTVNRPTGVQGERFRLEGYICGGKTEMLHFQPTAASTERRKLIFAEVVSRRHTSACEHRECLKHNLL